MKLITQKNLGATVLSLMLCTTGASADTAHDQNERWANKDLAEKAAMSLEKDLAIHQRWLKNDSKTFDGGSAFGYYVRETVKTWYYNRQDTLSHNFKNIKDDNNFEYDLDSSSDEIELKVKYNF